MQKDKLLNTFSAAVLLVIGLMYLIVKAIAFVSRPESIFIFRNDTSYISTAELMSEARTYFFIISGIAGGILLLRRKPAGWLIAVPYYIIYTVISLWWVILAYQLRLFPEMILAFILFSSLSVALYVLLRREAFREYKVTRNLLLLAVALLLVLVYFFFIAGGAGL